MSMIEKKAAAIRDDVVPALGPVAQFDPAMIALIVQVVTAVIKMIQDCQKQPADVPEIAKDPGLFGRMRLRRAIRRSLDVGEGEGIAVGLIEAAVFKVGAATTAEEAAAMFAEV
jgi:hypothetical protein